MKARAAESKDSNMPIHRRYPYQRALDGRKQPVRGLWVRNDRYYAQLRIAQDGRSAPRRVLLTNSDSSPCSTVAEAKQAMERLRVQRADDNLPTLKQAPRLAEYVETYLAAVSLRKGSETVRKEKHCLGQWVKKLGQLRISEIRKAHVIDFVNGRLAEGRNPRTANLDVIALRQLLKTARDADLINSLPTEGLRPLRCTTQRRELMSGEAIEKLIAIASEPRFVGGKVVTAAEGGQPLKNAQQFADYLRLLKFCGTREKETLRLRWRDIDFGNQQLVVGADGRTKNREARVVDFNPSLEKLLREMHQRRAPDSEWLFPSPQRGERDIPAKTFRESLKLAREAAGLPKFGFHDCRHHFASICVMAGIDYMTIARWLGHKDGGVLIGKVYGHLSNEHARRQADKLNFGTTT